MAGSGGSSVLRGAASPHPQVTATAARPGVGALVAWPLPSLQSRLQRGGQVVYSWHWYYPLGLMAP